MAEPRSSGRQAEWRDVLIVAVVVVGLVLGAAILTSALPTAIQQVVFHTPLAIMVLVGGTTWLLWRISRQRPE